MPLVRDVLELDIRMADGGEVFLDPEATPARVVEGRAHFRRALERARVERDDRLRPEPPPGD